jgi:hypothetical protein
MHHSSFFLRDALAGAGEQDHKIVVGACEPDCLDGRRERGELLRLSVAKSAEVKGDTAQLSLGLVERELFRACPRFQIRDQSCRQLVRSTRWTPKLGQRLPEELPLAIWIVVICARRSPERWRVPSGGQQLGSHLRQALGRQLADLNLGREKIPIHRNIVASAMPR